MNARENLRQLMFNYGLSGVDVVRQIHREIFALPVPEDIKLQLADLVGEAEYRIVEGSNDEIQLNSLLAKMAFLGKKIGYAK